MKIKVTVPSPQERGDWMLAGKEVAEPG